jgi:hypothetical protein
MSATTPVPFDDVFVDVAGSDFSLTNNFLQDSFHFTGSPDPAFYLLSPGTLLDLSGEVSLFSPSDRLLFNGIEYRASGTLTVSTLPVLVGTTVSTPFSITGTIHGQNIVGSDTVSMTLSAQGIATAQFFDLGSVFEMRGVQYEVSSNGVVPEPTSGLLLLSGLATLGVLRRRLRSFPHTRHSAHIA